MKIIGCQKSNLLNELAPIVLNMVNYFERNKRIQTIGKTIRLNLVQCKQRYNKVQS